MGTTTDKLNAIKNSKASIKAAIEAKNVKVGSVPFSQYAGKINAIKAAVPSGKAAMGNWIQGSPILPAISSFSVSKLDTSDIVNMSNMFKGQTGTTLLDLKNFDTGNVTNMTDMFSGCSSLSTLHLSPNWAANEAIRTLDLSTCPLSHASLIDDTSSVLNSLAVRTDNPVIKIKDNLLTKEEADRFKFEKGWSVHTLLKVNGPLKVGDRGPGGGLVFYADQAKNHYIEMADFSLMTPEQRRKFYAPYGFFAIDGHYQIGTKVSQEWQDYTLGCPRYPDEISNLWSDIPEKGICEADAVALMTQVANSAGGNSLDYYRTHTALLPSSPVLEDYIKKPLVPCAASICWAYMGDYGANDWHLATQTEAYNIVKYSHPDSYYFVPNLNIKNYISEAYDIIDVHSLPISQREFLTTVEYIKYWRAIWAGVELGGYQEDIDIIHAIMLSYVGDHIGQTADDVAIRQSDDFGYDGFSSRSLPLLSIPVRHFSL